MGAKFVLSFHRKTQIWKKLKKLHTGKKPHGNEIIVTNFFTGEKIHGCEICVKILSGNADLKKAQNSSHRKDMNEIIVSKLLKGEDHQGCEICVKILSENADLKKRSKQFT